LPVNAVDAIVDLVYAHGRPHGLAYQALVVGADNLP